MTKTLQTLLLLLIGAAYSLASAATTLDVGVATVDITPGEPIWLAGYAARTKPSEKVDSPLKAEALALRDNKGEKFVFVSLDNVGVSHSFMAPVLQEVSQKHNLKRGSVMVISSHTHSAPVLEGVLSGMYTLGEQDAERVATYSQALQRKLVEVVGRALEDFQPAVFEHATGRATFAMNRRIYQKDKVVFGENPEGPVDWDVPVLKISGTNGSLRAIVFGYACHGTSIAGDDWYIVSGDYMAYARQHLETNYPGATAFYFTGMGADSNPSPRGKLIHAKQHGVELAGAITGVLSHPMRPIKGDLSIGYAEADLPLEPAPPRDKLESDSHSQDIYIRNRAIGYLKAMDENKPPGETIKLPVGIVRIGDSLTFVSIGGEVVVDYSRKLNRLLGNDNPWLIGYAYEVPCYIPSARILKEGGYEADSSLIYYGVYGPFQPSVEDVLTRTVLDASNQARKAAH